MLAITRRPSATTPGQRRELAVEQHELRDRARRRRARAHRHADVGVLQRQRVVHAVAGHRDHVAPRLQRADHRPLLLRRDPAEHRVLPRAPRPARPGPRGARGRRSRRSASASPTASRDRGDGARVVARDHLERHALLVRSSAGSRRRRGGPSRRTSRAPPARGPAAAPRRRAARRCARARARGGRSAASSSARAARRRRVVGEHHLGRAHHPRARARRSVAALHLRADENGTAPVRVQPSGDVKRVGQRDRGGVAVLVVGERAERGAATLVVACRRAARARRTRSRPR